MSKPDWKDAPEWAQFLAMDKDGEWWWYERGPEWLPFEGLWDSGGASCVADVSEVDAVDSLEPRP